MCALMNHEFFRQGNIDFNSDLSKLDIKQIIEGFTTIQTNMEAVIVKDYGNGRTAAVLLENKRVQINRLMYDVR